MRVEINDLINDIDWGVDSSKEVKMKFIINVIERLKLWEEFFGWLLCVVLEKLMWEVFRIEKKIIENIENNG